jgi:FkbM family methyltransferase
VEHPIERWASWCKRHVLSGLGLGQMALLRTSYELALELLTLGRGVPRCINNDQIIRVSPRHRYIDENYEAEVFQYVRERIRPGQTVFDVGAYVGIYSIILSRWLGSTGKVFAFEPAPHTLKLLHRHLRLNGVRDRVLITPAAVGEEVGFATLCVQGDHIQNTLSPLASGLGGHYEEVMVPVVTLDQFCTEHGVRPDWIKIDTEGWELRVLRGARGLLSEPNPPTFLVEMHPYAWEGAGHDRRAVEAFCAELKLRARGLTGQQDPLSSYGTVVLEPMETMNA